MIGRGTAAARASAALGLPGAPDEERALTPVGALVLAAAVAGGCVVAHPLSLLVPAVVAALAVAVRRPSLLIVAAALAASALGARAEAGLAPPDRASIDAEVTLVSDPETRFGRVEAIARLDGRLVLLEADGAAADVVAVRLAGERVRVAGRLGPAPADAPWLRVRHVSGTVAVARAEPGAAAAPPWRIANRLRRLLAAGAAHLGDERRSLYLGLVLGDDRDQPPTLVDDFRGSGLSHLLAVSGQNVAFVLALAAPLLQRLSIGWRVVGVAVLLALFVVLTRGEPSVLRAVAMAGGAAVAAARGRPTPGIQLLGLAVAGCLLVDPLLVGSTGFHLSVAATLGILVLGPRLVEVLPGPPAVVLPVAVSASAQLGVAPLVVASFDGVPVSGLAANVLAAPAAALVMTWGLPAGLVAGLAQTPVDAVLHLPTRLALDWLAGVARGAASAPLGQLGWAEVGVVSVAVAGVLLAERAARPRLVRIAAVVLAVGALAAPGVALRHPPVRALPAPGVEVWRAGATVVVIAPGTGPTATLEGLRLAGVAVIDLLVVGPGPTAGDEERAARHRARVGRVAWMGRDPPSSIRVGGLVATSDGQRTHVDPAP
ncbi:MAG TPA: ComEC/Rec2 family competence protein [Iamia sp.]|nr:ComEC/Rec2 family competence protein [Iamia sp.]